MSTSNTIYISGLPPDASEQELAHHFGQVGAIQMESQAGIPGVWIYKDSHTGLPKGDAIVTYNDPYTAASAVQFFHQKPMRGAIVHVSLASMPESDASTAAYGHVQQGINGHGAAVPPMQDATYYEPSSQMYMQSVYGVATPMQTVTPATTTATGGESNASWNAEPETSNAQTAQKGSEATRGRKKITAAPQGPARLFGPDDWPCPSCGNTNWARRPRCNLCGAPKPGTLDMRREGQAGGFKELDEEEIEAARRRRKAIEEADDGELYDDYGRIKKKYRNIIDKTTREEAALARLRGNYDPSPSGQELAALFKKEETGNPEDQTQESEEKDEEQKQEEAADKTVSDETTKEKEQELTSEKESEKPRDNEPDRRRSPDAYRRYESRRRSISPRHSSRRHHSPYRERSSHRSRRSAYHHRSSDREDRYRYRR